MHGDIDESHRFAEFGPNHLERARTDAAGKDEDIGRIMPIDEAAESVTQARAIIIDRLSRIGAAAALAKRCMTFSIPPYSVTSVISSR